MLTDEAYSARKWRRLPLLQTVLEGKPVLEEWPTTSIEQTTPDRIGELIGIGGLLIRHVHEVAELANVQSVGAIHQEVRLVAEELQAAAAHLRSLAQKIDGLHGAIDRVAPDRDDSR